ncbi:MAG: AlpA family transcriptional regulator [Gammaproteobacteria bacterium BRH_c0]|nr:MAG: AlpA family transcriptional regulator [Gammaproteobacteria bacterium BRH_c0]
MATTILRLPEVKIRTGLSRSSIYLRVSEDRFPHPVSLGGRAVGWVASEIEAWLEQQINRSRGLAGSREA